PDVLKLTAWKGERLSGELLLWSRDPVDNVRCTAGKFSSEDGTSLDATASCRFVRYTLADASAPVCLCNRKPEQPAVLVPDMLDDVDVLDIEGRTVRPVWLSLDVPSDAPKGTYAAEVVVKAGRRVVSRLPVELTVVDRVLPPVEDWTYHLDLWQHPSAVARARGVDEWSDEHFAALREEMALLAAAGQKVITCTLNRDPWNHQCYDAYGDMIRWTLRSDGSWSYDYEVFDRWVSLMMSLGIDKMINCYSIVPWGCLLDYYDEASAKTVTVKAEPGTEEFGQMWKPFLTDFKGHLQEKGWLERTNIAMDERSPEQMDAAALLLAECAPEMGFAIADNHASYRKYTMMRDVCVAMRHPMDKEDIIMRQSQGFNSTFYVCCSTHYPNTFTFSQPYEAELLIYYGEAAGYDGMLRWAFNSWPADPAYDSRFGSFASGDTYFTYPGARSSVRFEKLRDGIENAEKIRALKASGDPAVLKDLDAILAPFRSGDTSDEACPWAQVVALATDALNML
ncbi:MAG: glycoside hydrolase domain-containing protein, partial [Candidatus Cryptobacteroides sp.]